MIARRSGRIISISSASGVTGTPNHVHYSAAKGGIVAFTKALAKELGQYGITVNAIAPGVVITDMTYTRTPAEAERFIEERKNWAVLGRIGTAQDMANLALFLASDQSSFITGQVIAADGGRTGLM